MKIPIDDISTEYGRAPEIVKSAVSGILGCSEEGEPFIASYIVGATSCEVACNVSQDTSPILILSIFESLKNQFGEGWKECLIQVLEEGKL